MAGPLEGCKVALLVAPKGTEHVEFAKPREALRDAGADVTVLGLESGTARTVHHDLEPGEEVTVDGTIDEAIDDEYDALIVPGGTVGADKLRSDERVIKFVRAFFREGKPVGVICHGPWTLVEADVVRGRALTSYPSLRTDVLNAGGDWQDREVVRDANLVTSRKPDDLPAFCSTLIEVIAEARHGAS